MIPNFRALPALLLLTALGCASADTSVRPGINDAYVDPDVDEWTDRFERDGREIFDRRDDIVDLLGLVPGSRVADVGAGTGVLLSRLSRDVGPQGQVYAVDIVPEFVEHLEQRARREGLGNVEVVLCTERSVELPEASVDVVVMCDVYHHLEYPKSTMTSIARALRRGGRVFVIDFRREPGESSEWVLEHVRAGRDVVVAEIEDAGLALVAEPELLEENYVLVFRRAD